MTTDKPLSVGVLGAARIAKKNCRAASHPYTSCRIAAVASRGEQKGKDFINEIFDENADDAPFVHGGNDAYNTLLENTVYDAVYIPLPTKLHETYVGKALTSGKHVLLEKPVAPSAEIYRQMLTTASENGKFLLDGTMFVHHPRTKSFITSIPNPNRVHFNFTFAGDDNFFKNDIRTKKEGDFLGCVGDLGWYCVRMGLLVFTGSDASVLKGSVTDVQVTQFQLNDEGVPLDADCLVYFSGSRILSFHVSFLHPLNQTVQISSSDSEYNAIETDAILPHKGDTITYNLVKQGLIQYDEVCTNETKIVESDNSLVQEVCMWGNFAKWARKIEETANTPAAVAARNVENEIWWGGDSEEVKEANAIASYSLRTQIVLDGLMSSIQNGGSKVGL
eukprot:scaffold3053_cov204-Alexandrium_tamarense.AAC.10